MDAEEGMTDLERLQARANAVTDGSLESTRRMMTMMEDVSIQYKNIKILMIMMMMTLSESSNWSGNT